MILLKMVANDEVRNVYVTYKDRLTRFGFHYLETIFLAHNVNIIVVKDVNNEKTVQEELVEDIDVTHESVSIPMQEDDIEYLKEFNTVVGGILNNYFDEV